MANRPIRLLLVITFALGACSSTDSRDANLGASASALSIDPRFVEHQQLEPSDDDTARTFGSAVAVSGDIAIVGSEYHDHLGMADTGAAYIFERSGNLWSEKQELIPKGLKAEDRLGVSVAIDAETALVGAFWDDDKGSNAGAAYVFVRDGSVWSEQQKLTAATSAALGLSVALDGDSAIVGSPGESSQAGAAYVFVRSGTSWTLQKKLVASDAEASDQFGFAVDIKGDAAIIGAFGYDRDANDMTRSFGAAYVYTRSGSEWTEQAKLLPLAPRDSTQFGMAVQIDGDTAAVGAPAEGNELPGKPGAAYVFENTDGIWTQTQKLSAAGITTVNWFGRRLALEGDRLVIGAPSEANMQGVAYLFTRSISTWAQTQKLEGSKKNSAGSVGLSGINLLVGSPTLDSTYVYALKDENGASCSEAYGCISGHCVDGVCCESACGGGATNDCVACNLSENAGSCVPLAIDTACGDQSDTACSAPDSCDAQGTCLPNHAADTTPCDDALFCTAESSCSDGSCRGQGDTCEPDKFCDEQGDMCSDSPPATVDGGAADGGSRLDGSMSDGGGIDSGIGIDSGRGSDKDPPKKDGGCAVHEHRPGLLTFLLVLAVVSLRLRSRRGRAPRQASVSQADVRVRRGRRPRVCASPPTGVKRPSLAADQDGRR